MSSTKGVEARRGFMRCAGVVLLCETMCAALHDDKEAVIIL